LILLEPAYLPETSTSCSKNWLYSKYDPSHIWR